MAYGGGWEIRGIGKVTQMMGLVFECLIPELLYYEQLDKSGYYNENFS